MPEPDTSVDLSTKTVLFIDNGLFTAFARKVAPAFKRALYYMPWQRQFVRSRELCVGIGFPEIERVRSPFRHGRKDLTNEVDLVVCLDQFHNDLQFLFEEKFECRVFGAREAEELELYRWEARKLFQKLGLPVLDAEHIIGMPALREHLQRFKDRWIKNSFNVGGRADAETFHHDEYKITKPRLDELEYDLGPGLSSIYEFISEANYPNAVEIGFDGYTIDGRYPDWSMQAFEVKGLGMFAVMKPYERLAEPVKLVNAALADTFKAYRYRGFWSSEIAWGKEQRPILRDPCCRLGSPSNELLQELIGNWPEIIWHGAAGEMIQPKVLAKYGVVVMVYSEMSGKNWEVLHYPEKLDQFVKLRNPTMIKGVRYAVPQNQPQNIAGIVGTGDTMLDAVRSVAERVKQVKGDRMQVAMESIPKALDVIAKGEELGIRFSDDRRYPSVAQLKAAAEVG